MKIIVPIKQVPDTKAVKMDEKTGTLIRQGNQNIINPLDLYAIELAIQLAEKYNGETIAISMGPPMAQEALKEAVAMGIDSAILVSDRAFAGSDSWATSRILSKAIELQGDVDLIICGERATDGDTGQVGPGIAAFLELPVLSYVNHFVELGTTATQEKHGVAGQASRCCVERLIEEGEERVESELPALLTVVKEVSEPRLPTLHGKRKARTLEIPLLTNKELELSLSDIGLKGSPTRVHKIFRPQVTREGEKITLHNEKDLATAVQKIIGMVKGGECNA